ncbi:hypothetical protein OH805_36945 [Streptomyces sp. NBC_00879]|uniref:hypothetical protein n=1 Tax=Streptomyces sp. NBC_00879 TaxID=2975855 RepID=UPI003864F4F6|nr:hypothetical protein OH805_36945 [Streptomyces sp. NBC_00879]
MPSTPRRRNVEPAELLGLPDRSLMKLAEDPQTGEQRRMSGHGSDGASTTVGALAEAELLPDAFCVPGAVRRVA